MEKRNILIADDVKINREILKVIFHSKYEIFEAEDGEQTIAFIEENSEIIDLLLLDINMPKKTGFDVLEFLKKKNLLAYIPVIMITASVDLEDELRAYQYGATDIVRKPFVSEVVLRRSENLIELFYGRKMLARELEEKTRELQGTLRYDALTGVLNMQQFLESADALLESAKEEECREYSFIYGNIRNFKYYNVKYGMTQGDVVLKKMADYVSQISSSILVGRFGQDHLVVMSKNARIKTGIELACEKFNGEYGDTGMNVKTGVYRIRSAGEKASAACEFAKLACDSIRNTTEYFCEYDEVLRRKIEIQTYVIQHFDEAISNHYIQVYYQPVIRTINGKTCGMEALARWIDPQMGFLSPADFISTLEENHLITKLDLYVLRRICMEMEERKAKGSTVVPISCNLSRTDFLEGDIFNKVDAIVAEYSIPHDMINIEITETAIMEDPEKMENEIQRFRDAGYQVWMDDFGSGYSSLNVLKDHQFDEIKLDMKFMSSFDDKTREIIMATVLMAKKLGIQTLAEGVETQEQFDFLRYIGCEKVQGYLFSKPLSPAEIKNSPLTKEDQMERRVWQTYYDQVGACNFITEKPLAVFEYDGKAFRFIYMNREYGNVLKGTGSPDLGNAFEIINSPSSPINRMLCDMKDRCHVGDSEQEIVYSIRDHFVRIHVRCIAEHGHCASFEVEMMDLTIDNGSEKQRTARDKVARQFFGMYDVVFWGNLATGEAEMLQQGNFGYTEHLSTLQAAKTIQDVIRIALNQIHPLDRPQFLKFVDFSTLKERMDQAACTYIIGYFRTLQSNGTYVWKAHKILYRADFGTAVYCTFYAYVEDEEFLSRIMEDESIRRIEMTNK